MSSKKSNKYDVRLTIVCCACPLVGFLPSHAQVTGDFVGTDEDEDLDASGLLPNNAWIDGGGGDDTITLTERRGFISWSG